MVFGILILWFFFTLLSLVFIIWDLFTNTPAPGVMKWAWILVILYTGPVGLFIYLLSCRQPLPGTHDAYIAAHWKQTIGSEIHCVAGDATAIIVMAGILHYFPLPNGLEAVLEYVAAYVVGLFVFQALFMRSMYSSYLKAVKETIFAETVSMNFVMAGMLPAVLVLKHFFPWGSDPLTFYFWGIMSFATLVGFVFAYPVNSWMVHKKIKHGMMTAGQPQMMQDHEHHESTPPQIHPRVILKWMLGSFVFLIWVFVVCSYFVPIRF